MNIRFGNSRVLILAAGVIVILVFSIYNFMDSFTSNAPGTGTEITPVGIGSSSLNSATETNGSNTSSGATQNVQSTSPSNSSNNSSSATANKTLNRFENQDKRENYYSIEFPADAAVVHGDKAGSYVSRNNDGVFTSRLQDIPDDTNVQLYILTQDEPQLKSSLQNYSQISFKQLTIGQQRAWNLVFTWKNGTSEMESARTYVEGPDEAMVIEFTAPAQGFAKSDPLITAVRESFQWI
jgi:hypothetical protein